MVDTFSLEIPRSDYHFLDYKKFHPSTEKMATGWIGGGWAKFTNNPPKGSPYGPRLTINARAMKNGGAVFPLTIEFSAPKMLFGDNVNETDESDFKRLVFRLQERMKEMGVSVTELAIRNAIVTAMHPSKNFELTGGYTASLAIDELGKINLDKRFDLDVKEFRNGGKVLQYYTNAHAFVFYDKIHDLILPKGRAFDKDQTAAQAGLFDAIKASKPRLELLRMEVRLCEKPKLDEVFEKIGYPAGLTFEEAFREDICKKILQLYWHEMVTEGNLFLFDMDAAPFSVAKRIMAANPKMKWQKALSIVGLHAISRDKGIQHLRTLLSSLRPSVPWYRVAKEIKWFDIPAFTSAPRTFVADVQKAIDEFTAYKANAE